MGKNLFAIAVSVKFWTLGGSGTSVSNQASPNESQAFLPGMLGSLAKLTASANLPFPAAISIVSGLSTTSLRVLHGD